MTVEAETIATLERARAAAPRMALATTAEKNDFLRRLASSIRDSSAEIIRANAIDLERARKSGRGGAFVERLTLDHRRIEAMAAGVLQVEALDDPVGHRDREMDASQRPEDRKDSGADRGDRDDLRIAPQRHRRCGRAHAQGRQCGRVARWQRSTQQQRIPGGIDRARAEGRRPRCGRGDLCPRSRSRSNPGDEAHPRSDRSDNSARRQVVEGCAGRICGAVVAAF